MPTAERPRVASIAAGEPFLDCLVRLVLAGGGADPLAVARTLVLLPTRRAAAALRDAFVQRAEGGLLLPRILSIADIPGSGLAGGEDTLAPALDEMAAGFLLAGILARSGTPAALALGHARGLFAALEELAAWERTPGDLERIDLEAALAAHWARTIAQLRVVTAAWPGLLADLGLASPAAARVAAVRALVARWRAQPQAAGRVIAAGFEAGPPFVHELLACIARLPGGLVVLGGLDLGLPEPQWSAIAPDGPHPQAPLKRLLDVLGVARAEVDELAPAQREPLRTRAVAGRVGRGGGAVPILCAEAASLEEEAAVIALRLREAVAAGRSCALVTPDRDLAARVIARLGRWDIRADDSAGRPLGRTPAGALARLAMAAAASDGAAELLALLEHPLVEAGEGRGAWLARVRQVDLAARASGDRPRPHDRERLRAAVSGELGAWLAGAEERLAPLADGGTAGFDRWVARLVDCLGRLGGEAVWQDADGRALRDVLDAALAHGGQLPALALAEAAELLDELLAAATVRPPPGVADPRVAIWGLLEARLQGAEILVLGGLNEGVWPGEPAPDPWLPPFARRALGLPGEATRVALAAHDLGMLLEAPAELLLTRARRDAAGPTVPSRFWLRLEAAGLLEEAPHHLAWARALDRAPGLPAPAPRPAPAPPVQLRPSRVSASRLDTLRADPFAIFAADVLGLRRLPWLDEPPGAAERGTALHQALSRWLEAGAPRGTLADRLVDELAAWLAADPVALALERPRLARAAQWAEDQLGQRRAAGWRLAAAERSAHRPLMEGVMLTGRADWVEVRGEEVAVLDFKTGTLPSPAALRAGFATQLGLLGALFADIGDSAGRVTELAYWRLSGGRAAPGEIRNVLATRAEGSRSEHQWQDPADFIAFCLDEARHTAARYLLGSEPFAAKSRPDFARMGDDFDHLARVEEWIGQLAVA